MSYDFRLFKPKPGEDPMDTAQEDVEELPSGAPDPEKEARKHRIADALVAHDPRLEIFEFDFDAIAERNKISTDEARLRYRHLELNGPDDDATGIQIVLFDDEASVTVPYWHDGSDASNVFRSIFDRLQIICREGGYLVYDPQIERIFDPSIGYDEALASYTSTVRKVRPFTSDSKKPWWKFW